MRTNTLLGLAEVNSASKCKRHGILNGKHMSECCELEWEGYLSLSMDRVSTAFGGDSEARDALSSAQSDLNVTHGAWVQHSAGRGESDAAEVGGGRAHILKQQTPIQLQRRQKLVTTNLIISTTHTRQQHAHQQRRPRPGPAPNPTTMQHVVYQALLLPVPRLPQNHGECICLCVPHILRRQKSGKTTR